MKKILLAVLSAALVAAVLISAGCVTTDTDAADPIAGVWVAGNDEDICVYIFDDDQTGIYYSTFADETYAKDGVEFLWENGEDGVYYLSNLNGRDDTCVLDAEAGTLTSKDNTVFRNIAAAFEDEAVDPIAGAWTSEDEAGSYLYIFANDNTGMYLSTDVTEDSFEGAEFVWVNEGNGVYHVTYTEDAVEEHCVLDAKEGTLTTDDDTVFVKL